MATFKYVAKDVKGKRLKGVRDAGGENELKAILKREKLLLIKAKELDEKRGKKDRFKIVRPKDIAIVTRELAAMLDGGVSLLRSVTILSTQDKKPGIKKALRAIKDDITAGYPFSYALSKHPKYFDNLYISMVKSGEESGNLDVVMNRIAKSLEKAEEIKGKVKGALIYPSVVLSLTMAVIFLLVAFVLPTFVSIFEDTGAEIPPLTAAVIAFSLWSNKNWYWVIVGIVVLVFAIKKVIKTEKGKRIYNKLQMRLPLFGNVIRKAINARFTRVMATLLESGVPILKSFEIVADAVGNVVVGEAILGVKREVEAGETISKPLEKSGVFPAMVVNMIDVGEESGNLVEMLNKVADFNERELEQAIRDMLAMFEPVVILILGVVVGTLVVAMYLPIFGLADAIA